MGRRQTETLVVGGGQAGLAMSHKLSQRGRDHLVVERRRIAERWRSERWDGLRFQFPNWSVRLPDFEFAHADKDGFATSEDIVAYLTAYAEFIRAPIHCGVDVQRLYRPERGSVFVADTNVGRIEASKVVVATGPYQRPVVPDIPFDHPILQLHASAYRDPAELPPGGVLVIGSGASGAQISEELNRAGRHVYLSVGRHRRMPRRYRGRDLIWWLAEMGLDQTPVEQRGPDKTLPLITGAYGGHTIDFRAFAHQGIMLLGRVRGLSNGTLQIAHDLHESLEFGDRAYLAFLDKVDEYVAAQRLGFPDEPDARKPKPDPSCVSDPVLQLNVSRAGIGSVIWATGYACDFSWIDLPIFASDGEPVHRRGVT